MNKTLISLIIPVYNAGPWLAPCLASITAQTHPAWECILVDDGSTDQSPAACDEAVAADSRFRVIHQANAGPAAARQTGLEAARGEWLCFVDGDDWLPPEYLARLLALAREREAAVAACAMCRFTGERPAPAPDAPAVTLTGDGIRAALLQQAQGMNWGLCSKLYHRSLFDNLRFAEDKICEDEGIIHYIVDKIDSAAVCAQPLYFYTQRAGSVMDGRDRVQKMDIFPFLQDRADYFVSRGMNDLAGATQVKYLVKCLQLYNAFADKTYKNHMLRMFDAAVGSYRKNPAASRRTLLTLYRYRLMPSSLSDEAAWEIMYGKN